MSKRILIADDDAAVWLGYLSTILTAKSGFEIVMAPTRKRCMEAITDQEFDVVLLDIFYASSQPIGFEVLSEIRAQKPEQKVIMFSNADDKETMLNSRRLGAGYVSKTRNSIEEIAACISQTVNDNGVDEKAEQRRLLVGEQIAREIGAVFKSEKMRQVFALAALARENTGVHVLIRGEQGVGKELVARAVSRPGTPFESLNCASITDTLLQSELFGHEKGAFTGSHKTSSGLIGAVRGGDLFLDEFGDLSLHAQAALLRAVEYGEVKKVGATKSDKIEFRIIAATNADLTSKVEEGSFREDFLSRFSRLQINIPSLRERLEDIRPLVDHMLKERGNSQKFSEDCLHLFEQYSWPGNIRQLRGVVLQVLDRIQRPIITINDLPEEFLEEFYNNSASKPAEDNGNGAIFFSLSEDVPFAASVRSFEKFVIRNHMARLGSNLTKSALAESLGIPRTNLRRKLEDLNLDPAFGRKSPKGESLGTS